MPGESALPPVTFGDRLREVAQAMRDRESEGHGFLDFQQDTVDWDGIVGEVAALLAAARRGGQAEGTRGMSARPPADE